jgi:hypothetical protein
MPALSGERYDLVQIEEWRRRRKGGRGPESPDGRQLTFAGDGDKDYWDKESKRYQAKLRELEYRTRLRELAEWKDIDQIFVARIIAVKQGLLTLARALPPQLIHCQDEREMEAIITRAVIGLLEEFSRPLPDLPIGGGQLQGEYAGAGLPETAQGGG